MLTKQAMLDAIAQLPDGATVEDAMEKLFVLEGIERGVEQADSGRVVTNDEAKRRLSHWLK